MSTARVLIADRDQVLLQAYGRFVADHGLAASFATSGLECIARLRDSQPDVLVLESGMLWVGAAGVLSRMHREPDLPTVPVILLAAVSDAEQMCQILDFPIDEFAAKPISPGGLLEAIQWVLYSIGPNIARGLPRPKAPRHYLRLTESSVRALGRDAKGSHGALLGDVQSRDQGTCLPRVSLTQRRSALTGPSWRGGHL